MNILDKFSLIGDIITGNNDKNKDKNVNISDLKEDLSKLTNNVYDSNNLQTIKKYYNKIAKIRNEKARDPKKNKIINPLERRRGSNRKTVLNADCDNDSVFSDKYSELSDTSAYSISNDPTFLINKADELINSNQTERTFVKKQNLNKNNQFLEQFQTLNYDSNNNPVSSNAVETGGSNLSRIQTERDLALNGGYSNFGDSNDMTYDIYNPNSLTHLNMVPQFKGKSYGDNILKQTNANNTFQRKMEMFTGLEPTKIPKTEIKPLFSPITGAENIYGLPSLTELLDSRYIPSLERRNERPFSQVRVTPGLNLGYNEINRNGDNFRVLPKDVNDLRTANKPKSTFSYYNNDGFVGPQGGKGERGSVIGQSFKHKAERTKDWGYDRHQRGLGYIRAPMIYGKVDVNNLATKNRGVDNTEHFGVAKHDVDNVLSDDQREKYNMPSKQNYLEAEPRNIILVEGLQARENEKPYIPDATQREQSFAYYGALGTSQILKGTAFDMITNIFDLTNRNIHDKYDRTGLAISGDIFKGKADDPNDVPNMTLRNVHDKYDRNGYAITGDLNKGKAYDPNDVQDLTMRNVHDKYDRNGYAITGDLNKGKAYDPNDVQDLTMRNVHSQYDRAGATITGDLNKGKAYDPNDVQDPTMRNVHDKYDRAGATITGDLNKGKAYDPNDVQDPTMRNVHDKYDRNGLAITGDLNKGQAYDPKDVQDPTMRDIHDKFDRVGMGIYNRENDKGYAINYTLFTPDLTLREMTEPLNRVASGAFDGNFRATSRDAEQHMLVNESKQQIEKGRAPTRSSYSKTPTMDMTMVRMCEKIQISRDLMASTIAINDKLPFITTKTPMNKYVHNTRLDSHVKINLDHNPFINNIVHVASDAFDIEGRGKV
jgi:hypothetical protein